MGLFGRLPFLVLLMGIGALSMYLPAFHALSLGDHRTGRAFFYSGTLFLILTALIGLATANYGKRATLRGHLMALVGAYLFLPVMLAVPVAESVPNMRFLNVYFEMVSSMTTTGATIFTNPELVPNPVHLWRAMTGWMGGFLVWVMAVAILAPMNLGGFEVTSFRQAGHGSAIRQISSVADPDKRLARFAQMLLPIYAGLTLLLWIGLVTSGLSPLMAVTVAMSTLATSGIVPTDGLGDVGFAAEALIVLFLVFALSRQTFSVDRRRRRIDLLRNDPELRLAAVLVVGLPIVLLLRHGISTMEAGDAQGFAAAVEAFWGAFFTVLSFLTTTGFASAGWEQARIWSGLETSSLLLAGLAIFGGGVATTAGGVKLLRVYALYKHGLREMDKLVHPNSVGGAGVRARQIRREGAYIAWIFFMLFALSISAVMSALALAGLSFEVAVTLTVAALTNTGPIAQVAMAEPISYATLPDSVKYVLVLAMILGRLELLAIIALLNPDFWRA